MIREISASKNKTGEYVLNFVFLKICLCVFIFSIIFYTSSALTAFQDIKSYILIIAISECINSFSQAFCSVLVAYEKMKQLALIYIFRDIVVTIPALTILFLKGNLLLVVWCYLISALVTFVLAAILFRGLKINLPPSINFRAMAISLKKGLPFVLSAMFIFMVFRIDIVLLKLFKGNYSVGIYRAAYSFFMNLEIFPSLLILSLYPKFSRLFKKNSALLPKLYKKASLYLLIINGFVLLAAFILSKALILTFFGTMFAEAVNILRYAVFAVFFLFQNIANFYLLNAINKPLYNTVITGIGLSINILLDLLFIPTLGYYGVLLAISVSYLFMFIASSIVVNRLMLEKNKIEKNQYSN